MPCSFNYIVIAKYNRNNKENLDDANNIRALSDMDNNKNNTKYWQVHIITMYRLGYNRYDIRMTARIMHLGYILTCLY